MSQSYVGYSTDPQIRYKSTSGGVGSAIIKYMLDSKKCDYALSFDWDEKGLCYHPKLITDFSQYNICGSIYQEMNLMSVLKGLLQELPKKGKIILFSLPCQTKALRKICELAGYESIIIGLTCSSQQSKEATSFLLKYLGIKEEDVKHLQYRGNGWPSGIQIETKDGVKHFVKNNGSIWEKVFHSRLFIQPRCFACINTLNEYSDIALADPWIRGFENETTGQTLFTPFSEEGESIVEECKTAGYIEYTCIDKDQLYLSQRFTIARKNSYNANPRVRNWMKKVFLSGRYHRLAVKNYRMLKMHLWLLKHIERRIIKY